VAGRFALRASAHGQIVEVEATDALLDADPLRVEQALGNLVDNALAHGGAVVTLGARERDGVVELHVTDDGPGFPEDFVDRAFDRFSRADDARGRGGTGLGLSIVALIAAAHGCAAGASNRPSGGADVWLAVPMKKEGPPGASSSGGRRRRRAGSDRVASDRNAVSEGSMKHFPSDQPQMKRV
jgi:signal transduction histidine kinase